MPYYIYGKVIILRLPSGGTGKESACQFRRQKRCNFNPWVRKFPQRME